MAPDGGATDTVSERPPRYRRWWQTLTKHMEPAVFLPAAALIIGFVLFGTIFPSTAARAFETAQTWITANFGWFYLLTATLLLVGCITLLFGPVGRIRLGGEDAEPEFPRLTWFTMMLSAGMGIGIVFFGIAEPIQHFDRPPGDAEARTAEAAVQAMRYTFFHWGLHPWAIYTAIALPLAYFHFRLGLPMAPRSMLYPMIGERIHGWIGHVVDTICTVGTLFGVATSLGLGSAQINAGLSRIAGLEVSTTAQIVIIAVITGVATISVVSGVHKGIRRLSEFNLALLGVVLVFMLITGPTIFQLDLFVSGLGNYLQHLPMVSLTATPGAKEGWQSTWTLFYWSWWISWSPFVGVFTARISKGRTVREFILTAMLVPTIVGFLWFAVVGGTGIEAVLAGDAQELPARAREDEALSLYMLLDLLPWASIMSVLATVLIVVFFVTSSDSGSLVDDMVTSGGNPNPPRIQRVFWAIAEGAVATTLLLAGAAAAGDANPLSALRNASLTTGLPLALLLLVGLWGLIRALRVDARRAGVPDARAIARAAMIGGSGRRNERSSKAEEQQADRETKTSPDKGTSER
jgi:choline/glycine/proline betaine transport protein